MLNKLRGIAFAMLALASCKQLEMDCSSEEGQSKPECQIPCNSSNNNVTDAISYGSGALHSCVISDGKLKCWGENQYGDFIADDLNNRGDAPNEMGMCLPEIDLGSNAYAIKVVQMNMASACALLSDGSIKCWGNNYFGHLGLGDRSNRVSSAMMGDNLLPVDLGAGAVATDIAVGNRNACAIIADGSVRCWGAFSIFEYIASNPGFVGDSSSDMGNNVPSYILPAGRPAIKIALGDPAGVCAVLDDNSLYCWHYKCEPDSGHYIGPTFTCDPAFEGGWIPLGMINVGAPVADITLGRTNACALLTGGQVKCWGSYDGGKLGQGDTVHRGYSNATMNQIPGIPNIDLGSGRSALKVSAGLDHVCALLDNYTIKCWGENEYGQLGLEDTNDRGDEPGEMGDNLPAVNLGSGRTALDVSAGAYHTCALLDDHSVKCWGLNGDVGRLGQGDAFNRGDRPSSMGDALLPIQIW